MTTAVITLDTGGKQQECCTLFNDLSQYSNLPSSVDKLILCDPNTTAVDFATLVPVTTDYSGLSPNPEDQDSFKKLFTFLMPYDRAIYLSPDLSYKKDVSVLWSESHLLQHLLYARHLPNGFFDDNVMVFNHNLLLGFHDILVYLTRTRLFEGYGYTCKDVLNGYFCHTKRKVGDLSKELNLG